MGIRFLGSETIPCVVTFLDQTQPTIEGVMGTTYRFHKRKSV